ncbi:type III-B CRISPR-associated protein Cas10/Cmr2 [Sulfurisphaera ohwakuensis]|uniref:CRISPR-associated protein Cmr2 n=1 Tax=Sulfurisphaera ohwakuensis TaxID=69656 RepID=A0A650CIK8_SULOH|nr:type III-B CRISPR-associated protein Cas10/Cmr2 [Sulfurisphaera ohwakuensis]MBB5253321.1 CRISPR-associated protein Cmr2 [Sulfurisphaera ohwakuensis]QGR17650.1 type III-B CRISPR-associated protein Cas10/Cmr2 [Sulfurisphaera ohwakuensis]
MSENNISRGEFLNYKITALLHDPPNKAWVITGRATTLTSQLNKVNTKKKHEEVAKYILNQLFSINYSYYSNKVGKADNIASSVDRYLGSIVYKEHSFFRNREIFLKNILSPDIQRVVNNLFPEDKSKLDNLISRYNNLLNAIRSTNLNVSKYQLFYLIYELVWIESGYENSPSDTRNPTHTIFDHLYATAAMMNWILTFKDKERGGNKGKGYLLGIDTIGVADFISKGRKTRDLWISSYLVSALLWYVITWFIEEYGLDVVLFPSLRFNQFYAFYLLEKLRKEGVSEDVIDEVKELITKYIFNGDDLFEDLKIPPYPIIPGRVTLILPGLIREGEEYKNLSDDDYFISKAKDRYNEGWRKLIEGLKLYSERRREDGFWNLVCRVLTLTEDLLQITPLNIRVKQVSVTKDEIFDKNGSLRSDAWKVYDNKYRKLVSEFKRSKLVKVTPESRLKLFELTKFDKLPQIGEKSKRGYEFCTSCGVLPAVVIMPKEEDFEKKLIDSGIASNENDVKSIKNMISPGERLCPWCLVKRALGAEPRLLRILLLGDLYSVEDIVDEIINEETKNNGNNKKIEIPSTSDIASIKTFEEMIEKKDELCKELDNEICKQVPERLSMWKWFNENKSKGINLTIDPEEYWFSEERRRYYFSIFRRYGITFPSPYYALIRADSDYLGDLLEGKLTPYLAGIIDSGDYANIAEKKEEIVKFLEDYLLNAGSGRIVEYVKNVIYCISAREDTSRCPCAVKIYSDEIARSRYKNSINVEKSVENSINYFKEILREGRIIVTPAWHVSISSALNRGLIAEINLINKHKGFVIYAGGDDLLALLPVSEVLDFIKESRKAFAGYGGRIGNLYLENGFVEFNNAYYPSLPTVGRSYSVIISHYADPLSMVVNESYYLLEEGKEMVSIYNGDKRMKKDIAIFEYHKLLSVIPLSLNRPIVSSVRDFNDIASIIDLILTLKKKIDEGEISTSLLYDYDNYRDLISSENGSSLIEFLLKYWIRRNSASLKDVDELMSLFKPEYFTTKMKSRGYHFKEDLVSNVVYALRIIYGGA